MAIQAAALAASAFNLVCSGAMVTSDRSTPPAPTNFELRIDLNASRWCNGDCLETKPIDTVTDTVIGLEAYHLGPFFIITTVSRESGRYESKMEADINGERVIIATNAQCELAPFTGFPQRKF